MSELFGLDKFIDSQLRANTALNTAVGGRFYKNVSPQGAVLPYVVWNLQAARDRWVMGGYRFMTLPLLQVKAVTQGNSAQAGHDIDTLVDTVITGASGVVTNPNVTIQGAIREQPLDYSEVEGGVRYNHVGGLYRFVIHRTV